MIVKKSCYSNIRRNAEYLDNDNKGIIIVEGKIIWKKKAVQWHEMAGWMTLKNGK